VPRSPGAGQEAGRPLRLLPGEALVGPEEARRLVALYQLDVLDAAAGECFDRVVRLAARLFEVPYARICLVDAVREWCLAEHGNLASELPREQSIADLVARADDVTVWEDTRSSVPLKEHPFVTGKPGVGFVAGSPLRSASGAVVGALYLLGTKPRQLGPSEQQMLHDLAGIVDDELAMRANRCFDEQTGLLLRRGFDIVGAHVVSRARRRGEPVSLIVVDLDASASARRLRSLDGEQEPVTPAPAGSVAQLDAAVALVADVISAATRSSDVPARLPCDELAVLLPDTDERRCLRVARRIGEEIAGAAMLASCPPFAAQLAAATIDGALEELSIAALLRKAAPLDLELAVAGGASSTP
jgi:GGDEF domain-containing protein